MDNVITLPVHEAYLDILVLALKKDQLLFKKAQRNDPHQKPLLQLMASLVKNIHII